jgi:hypothetical protein
MVGVPRAASNIEADLHMKVDHRSADSEGSIRTTEKHLRTLGEVAAGTLTIEMPEDKD